MYMLINDILDDLYHPSRTSEQNMSLLPNLARLALFYRPQCDVGQNNMAAGWCFIVCTLVLLEIFLVDTLGQDIVRDGSLRDLALLLNNEKYRELFQHWTGSLNDTIAFLSLLEPWIVATPAAPLPDIDKQRDEVHVNCQAPVYESSLATGFHAINPA